MWSYQNDSVAICFLIEVIFDMDLSTRSCIYYTQIFYDFQFLDLWAFLSLSSTSMTNCNFWGHPWSLTWAFESSFKSTWSYTARPKHYHWSLVIRRLETFSDGSAKEDAESGSHSVLGHSLLLETRSDHVTWKGRIELREGGNDLPTRACMGTTIALMVESCP